MQDRSLDRTIDYEIGSKFKTRGKYPKECTVVDILRTYNSDNILIKVRYVATYNYCGELITDSDVPGTTIAMGLIAEEKK